MAIEFSHLLGRQFKVHLQRDERILRAARPAWPAPKIVLARSNKRRARVNRHGCLSRICNICTPQCLWIMQHRLAQLLDRIATKDLRTSLFRALQQCFIKGSPRN